MLKLKLQCFGHLIRRADSEKAWGWERLGAGREVGDRGWDGWMASPTQWTWVWASSGSWWRIGKPGVLQSMGSQRVRHDWATELNTEVDVNLYLTTGTCSSAPSYNNLTRNKKVEGITPSIMPIGLQLCHLDPWGCSSWCLFPRSL